MAQAVRHCRRRARDCVRGVRRRVIVAAGSLHYNRSADVADRLLWLALPALASLMLLAATNHICQDVAVVPFLWVVPLALYLLSFIICFDHAAVVRPAGVGSGGRAGAWSARLPCDTSHGFESAPWVLVKLLALFCGLVLRVHGLSRRTGPAEARSAISDRILLADRHRRRIRRRAGGHRGAAGVFDLCGMADRRERLVRALHRTAAAPGLRPTHAADRHHRLFGFRILGRNRVFELALLDRGSAGRSTAHETSSAWSF